MYIEEDKRNDLLKQLKTVLERCGMTQQAFLDGLLQFGLLRLLETDEESPLKDKEFACEMLMLYGAVRSAIEEEFLDKLAVKQNIDAIKGAFKSFSELRNFLVKEALDEDEETQDMEAYRLGKDDILNLQKQLAAAKAVPAQKEVAFKGGSIPIPVAELMVQLISAQAHEGVQNDFSE